MLVLSGVTQTSIVWSLTARELPLSVERYMVYCTCAKITTPLKVVSITIVYRWILLRGFCFHILNRMLYYSATRTKANTSWYPGSWYQSHGNFHTQYNALKTRSQYGSDLHTSFQVSRKSMGMVVHLLMKKNSDTSRFGAFMISWDQPWFGITHMICTRSAFIDRLYCWWSLCTYRKMAFAACTPRSLIIVYYTDSSTRHQANSILIYVRPNNCRVFYRVRFKIYWGSRGHR